MNKKIYNEDLTLNLILNGDKMQKASRESIITLQKISDQTQKLRLRQAELEQEKRKMKKTDADYERRLKSINRALRTNEKQIRLNEAAMQGMRAEIGLAGLTINQLNSHLRVLQAMLRSAGSEAQRISLRKQIAETDVYLKKATTGAGRLSQAWTRLAQNANRYSAAIGWITGAFYLVGHTVGQLVQRLGFLDRKLSGVMKTTGLTREEAQRLKHEFDLMQTPTKTDHLLDMARIAGKLGLEGYENIKHFTGAVDVLNVALGDDLNLSVEETAEKVGKLVNSFRVTDHMPIDEALLRTGSLLNDLDKSSVASAGTILEYMTRLSSLGTTAKYPMEQLAGLAATLETVNIPAERGSTALRNIISGLGKNVDRFRRILGMGVEEYKQAVEKDINEVFLRLMEMTSKGDESIIDVVNSMGDMEITGVRVAEVYGALAKNLDVVRTQQEIATRAFQNSNSVMREYLIIIGDYQGDLDSQKKRIRALIDDFNMRYGPVGLRLYRLWVDMLYSLKNMARWIGDHINSIKSLISVYLTLKSVAIAKWFSSIITSIGPLTLQLTRLTGVWKALPKAMQGLKLMFAASMMGNFKRLGSIFALLTKGLSPLTIAITGIVAAFGLLGVVVNAVKSRTDLVARSFRNLSVNMQEQLGQMNALFDAAQNSQKGSNTHIAAIKALNELYGKYLPHLLTEKDSIDAITQARQLANQALEREIALKWQNENMADIDERNMSRIKKQTGVLMGSKKGADAGMAAKYIGGMIEKITYFQGSPKELDDYANQLGEQYLKEFGSPGADKTPIDIYSLLGKKAGAAIRPNMTTDAQKANREQLAMERLKESVIKRRQDKEQAFGVLKGFEDSVKPPVPLPMGLGKSWSELSRDRTSVPLRAGEKLQVKPRDKDSFVPLRRPEERPQVDIKIMTEEEYDKETKLLKLAQTQEDTTLNERLLSKEEFQRQEMAMKLRHIDKMIELENRYVSADAQVLADLQNDRAKVVRDQLDFEEEQRKKALEDAKNKDKGLTKEEKEAQDRAVEELAAKHEKRLADLKTSYLKGELMGEDHYNALVLASDMEFFSKKMEIFKEGSLDYQMAYNDFLQAQFDAEMDLDKKLLSMQKQVKRLRPDKLIEEVQSALDEEDERWDEEETSLNSLEIKKPELSDKEKEYNKNLKIVLAAKKKEHDQKVGNINYVKKQPQIAQTEKELQYAPTSDDLMGSLNMEAIEKNHKAKKELVDNLHKLELEGAQGNLEKINNINEKYAQKELEIKMELFDAEKALNEAKIGMVNEYASALIAIVGQESAVGKALFVFQQGLAIAQVWINTAVSNAAIMAKAMAMFAYLGPLSPAAAVAFASAPIAANNTNALLQTGLIAAQTVGTMVTQWARGKYPVVGEDDGHRYMASWTGDARTGIYSTPSLIAEKGPEMVIDYPTLKNIRMNSPRLIDSIMQMRVPQRAVGKYPTTEPGAITGGDPARGQLQAQGQLSQQSVEELTQAIQQFMTYRPSLDLRYFERMQSEYNRATKGGIR